MCSSTSDSRYTFGFRLAAWYAALFVGSSLVEAHGRAALCMSNPQPAHQWRVAERTCCGPAVADPSA
jgi:hypothetical protein